jgi:hypothetical protein
MKKIDLTSTLKSPTTNSITDTHFTSSDNIFYFVGYVSQMPSSTYTRPTGIMGYYQDSTISSITYPTTLAGENNALGSHSSLTTTTLAT